MRSYKLNKFYSEAKRIIEQYGFAEENCRLRVHFEIEESPSNAAQELTCVISYEYVINEDADPKEWIDRTKLFEMGVNPERTLEDFELKLRKKAELPNNEIYPVGL